MAVIQMTTVLAGIGSLLADYTFGAPPVQRIRDSDNTMLNAPNIGVALASGVPTFQSYVKLSLYVSTGPSNVTIRTLDGTSVTLSALASGTRLILDVQFTMVTWTGTATAVAYLTE